MTQDQRPMGVYEIALALARSARILDALDQVERQANAGDGQRAHQALVLARYWINRAR